MHKTKNSVVLSFYKTDFQRRTLAVHTFMYNSNNPTIKVRKCIFVTLKRFFVTK